VLLASGVQDLPATDLVMFDDVTSRGVGIDEFMSGSMLPMARRYTQTRPVARKGRPAKKAARNGAKPTVRKPR
jgi:hypothetical protein